MLLLGGGMGGWLRPHTISRRWPNGKMQYELNVRRAWNGELLTNGQQRWWRSNGELAITMDSRGEHLPRYYAVLPSLLVRIEAESAREVNWSNYRFAETEHDP